MLLLTHLQLKRCGQVLLVATFASLADPFIPLACSQKQAVMGKLSRSALSLPHRPKALSGLASLEESAASLFKITEKLVHQASSLIRLLRAIASVSLRLWVCICVTFMWGCEAIRCSCMSCMPPCSTCWTCTTYAHMCANSTHLDYVMCS